MVVDGLPEFCDIIFYYFLIILFSEDLVDDWVEEGFYSFFHFFLLMIFREECGCVDFLNE